MTLTNTAPKPSGEVEHRDGELWIIAGQVALAMTILIGFGAASTVENFTPRMELPLVFAPTAAMVALAPPQSYRRIVLSLPVLLYVSWWMLSVTWTYNTGGFIVDSQNQLFFAGTMVIVACYLPLPSFLRGLVYASYATILWTIFYTVLYPDLALINQDGVPGWRGGFIHKNGMAPFMLFAATTIAMFETHRLRRYGAIAIALFFVAMAQSTTSLIAGAFLVVAWLTVTTLTQVPPDRRGRMVVIGGALGFSAAALTMSWLPNVVTAFGKDPTLTSRTDIWAGVMTAIADRPVEGYGIGGVWIDQAAPHTRAIQQQLGFVVFHSHNGYLEIALQLGLVGLLLFAVLVFATGHRAIAILDSQPRLGAYTLLFLTLMLVTSISEVMTFGMWFGMLCALATLAAKSRTHQRHAASATLADPMRE